MEQFNKQVYDIVGRIPAGKVVSYGQIAWMLGRPYSARAVGQAIRHCPYNLPWHRVVKSDGTIAKSIHSDLRKAMLEAEHIPFLSDNRVDIKNCRWHGEQS